MDAALIWLHVSANVVWIGAIIAVGVILASRVGDPKSRGELATRVYLRVAAPAFVVSFVCGAVRLSETPTYFLHQHWMHGKLAAALVVIGLHHVIGGRAKKLARGEGEEPKNMGLLTAILGVAAVAVVFFAILHLPA